MASVVRITKQQYLRYLQNHLEDLDTTRLQQIRNRTSAQCLYDVKGVSDVKILRNVTAFTDHENSFSVIITFDDEKYFNWFLLQL